MASNNLESKQKQEADRLLALANVQRLREQYVEAEDTCRKALEVAPSDVFLMEMLADILQERGKPEDALAVYKSAMETAPGRASLETKYAKLVIEIAERERNKAIAEDMINNPHKYVIRKKNPAIAFIAAAVVPGLGQLYNGETIKAGILFGVFLVFLVTWAATQGGYGTTRSIEQFFASTNPLVLILGFLAGISYLYGVFDAVFTASKASAAAKSKIKR